MTSRSSHLKWNRGVATILAISLFLSSSFAQAQEASTPPVGVLTIEIPGGSDTIISIPFHRPTVFRGVVESVDSVSLVVGGNPGWEANSFKYDTSNEDNYYLLFCSGQLNGLEVKITGNDSRTIFFDALAVSPEPGDIVEIVPYWTLDTFFEGQSGIVTTSSVSSSTASKVTFVDDSTPGVNHAAGEKFYYVESFDISLGAISVTVDAGWRSSLQPFDRIVGNQILPNDKYFIIRSPIPGEDRVLTISGDVSRSSSRIIVDSRGFHESQDFPVSFKGALPTSVGESNLFESGVFKGARFPGGSDGDKLVVFNNSDISFNKSQSVAYYYFDGDFPYMDNGVMKMLPKGWRKSTALFDDNVYDSDQVFSPGKGYLIRKKSDESFEAESWIIDHSYLENL